MRVAIVGSRGWSDMKAIEKYVAALPPDTVLVSGGAVGVDRAARTNAAKYGLIIIEVLPAWSRGWSAGFERNSIIVELADRVVAFWDGDSNGTRDTIKKAKAAGKPTEVITGETR